MRDASRTPATAAAQDEELYESQRSRVAMPLEADERLLSAVLGGAFLVVAVVLALVAGDGRAPSPIEIGVLVVAFAALANVEFEIGTGAAIPPSSSSSRCSSCSRWDGCRSPSPPPPGCR